MSVELAEDVARSFAGYLTESLSVDARGETGVVRTPFLLPNNEAIAVGVRLIDHNDRIELTDMGCVSDFFFANGKSLADDAGLQDAAMAISRRFRVTVTSSQISIEADLSRAAVALYVLAHAAVSLASVEEGLPKKPSVDFPTTVKSWIAETAPSSVRVETDFRIPVLVERDAHRHDVEYEVDAAFFHDGAAPRLLQAVGNGPSAYRAAFIYQSLVSHRITHPSALLYNEEAAGWSRRYVAVLEDTPAEIVVPYSQRRAVMEWAEQA